MSYEVLSVLGGFGLRLQSGDAHSAPFRDAAGTVHAHGLAIGVAKGMAAVALRVFTDETYTRQVRANFICKSNHLQKAL